MNMNPRRCLPLLAAVAVMAVVGQALPLAGDNNNIDSNSEYQCDGDSGCAEGQYCFFGKSYSECVSCIDCGRLFRLPSDRSQCAEKDSECGPCLPGFEEETLNRGKKREKCLVAKWSSTASPKASEVSTIPPESAPMPAGTEYYLLLVVVAILAAALIAGLVFAYKYLKKTRPGAPEDATTVAPLLPPGPPTDGNGPRPLDDSSPIEHPRQSPPPYSEVAVRRDDVAHDVTRGGAYFSDESEIRTVVTVDKERLQKAEKFKEACYNETPNAPPPEEDVEQVEFEMQAGVREYLLLQELRQRAENDDDSEGNINRPPSPANSDTSTATEPSLWTPGPIAVQPALERLAEEDELDEEDGHLLQAGADRDDADVPEELVADHNNGEEPATDQVGSPSQQMSAPSQPKDTEDHDDVEDYTDHNEDHDGDSEARSFPTQESDSDQLFAQVGSPSQHMNVPSDVTLEEEIMIGIPSSSDFANLASPQRDQSASPVPDNVEHNNNNDDNPRGLALVEPEDSDRECDHGERIRRSTSDLTQSTWTAGQLTHNNPNTWLAGQLTHNNTATWLAGQLSHNASFDSGTRSSSAVSSLQSVIAAAPSPRLQRDSGSVSMNSVASINVPLVRSQSQDLSTPTCNVTLKRSLSSRDQDGFQLRDHKRPKAD